MLSNSPQYWKKRGGIATALLPLAVLYQLGYRLRRMTTRPAKLQKAKLLCVGNLVAGGAGKTPVALDIGEYAAKQGIRACYLSKGYGGSITAPTLVDANRHSAAEVGDEPLMLARTLPTIIARDRVKGARFAESQGFELLIVDDGFQNPTLKPDIALVVVDAVYGLGNGHTLPAGPLREPAAYGLKRADAVVVLRRDRKSRGLFADSRVPTIIADLRTSCPAEAEKRKLVAFSGIARPEQFFESLVQHCGLHLVGSHAFADHHLFTTKELDALREEAHKLDATLITTAKDATRLPPEMQSKVMVAKATLNWHNAADLHAVLAPLIPRKEA